MSLIVTFAIEQEFAPWRRLRRFDATVVCGERCYRAAFSGQQVFITFTGIGAPRIEHLRALVEQSGAGAAIVTGLAGGLNPIWQSGDVLAAEAISEPSRLEAARSDLSLLQMASQCGAKTVPRFVTVDEIVRTREEKARLSQMADAVEMESAHVMKELARNGIPALAMRAIADTAATDLPCDFGAATDAKGEVRMSSVAGELARKPRNLPSAIRFGVLSRRAARNLAEHLVRFAQIWSVQYRQAEKSVSVAAG